MTHTTPQARTNDPETSKANVCYSTASEAANLVEALMRDGVPRTDMEIADGIKTLLTADRLRHGRKAHEIAGNLVWNGQRRPTGNGKATSRVWVWTVQ